MIYKMNAGTSYNAKIYFGSGFHLDCGYGCYLVWCFVDHLTTIYQLRKVFNNQRDVSK